MHPKCWWFENFKKIGDMWGKTLKVEHDFNGVNNITAARILVQTTSKKRIETSVKVEWELSDCEIWVTEVDKADCMGKTVSDGSLHGKTTEECSQRSNGIPHNQRELDIMKDAREPLIEGATQEVNSDQERMGQNEELNAHMKWGRT